MGSTTGALSCHKNDWTQASTGRQRYSGKAAKIFNMEAGFLVVREGDGTVPLAAEETALKVKSSSLKLNRTQEVGRLKVVKSKGAKEVKLSKA